MDGATHPTPADAPAGASTPQTNAQTNAQITPAEASALLREKFVRVRIIATTTPAKLRSNADAHEAIEAVVRKARVVLDDVALPIPSEDNWRLVPVGLYPEFLRGWAACRREHQEKVDALASHQMHGPQAAHGYSLQQRTEPYPESRFGALATVSAPLSAKLAEAFDQTSLKTLQEASKGMLELIHARCSYFADRIDSFESRPQTVPKRKRAPGEKPAPRVGVFRDSLLTNIVDAVRMCAAWNVAVDPQVHEACALLGGFAHVKPEVLRTDPRIREATKARALYVASRIEPYLPGKDAA